MQRCCSSSSCCCCCVTAARTSSGRALPPPTCRSTAPTAAGCAVHLPHGRGLCGGGAGGSPCYGGPRLVPVSAGRWPPVQQARAAGAEVVGCGGRHAMVLLVTFEARSFWLCVPLDFPSLFLPGQAKLVSFVRRVPQGTVLLSRMDQVRASRGARVTAVVQPVLPRLPTRPSHLPQPPSALPVHRCCPTCCRCWWMRWVQRGRWSPPTARPPCPPSVGASLGQSPATIWIEAGLRRACMCCLMLCCLTGHASASCNSLTCPPSTVWSSRRDHLPAHLPHAC